MKNHFKIIVFFIACLLLTGCAKRLPTQYNLGPGNNQYQFANSEYPTTQPQKIAVLLPLTGNLGASGQAIRNGILAAFYAAQAQKTPLPTLEFINTADGNISDLYQKALAGGADYVIGPLLKSNVDALAANNHISVPTITLNSLTTQPQTYIPNLFQFGLSPADDSRQIAVKAYQAGFSRAIIIAPQNSFGQSMADAFSAQWTQLGGQVVGNLAFPSDGQNLAPLMREVLGINQSNARAAQLQQTIQQNFRFLPRRRQDVNVIFVAALPQTARSIKPLLNFYFAGNIPVYSPSVIYGGIPAPTLDRDLDGITFCDMPWVLDKSQDLPSDLQTMQQNILKLWPESFQRYPKLYALGIDAYQLIAKLPYLMQSPSHTFSGATGILYLNQHLQINRSLSWAKFEKGEAVLLQSNA